MKKKSLLAICSVWVMLFFATVGSADVIDPMDNISAPPGTFVLVSYFNQLHYPDITDKDGNESNFGLDLSLLVLRPVYFIGKIADTLSYGVNAIIPVGHLSFDSDNVFGAPSVNEFGIGDIGISPFIYLYENPDTQLYISFWEFIFMPTGDYSMNNFVNIGRDTWWFQHQIAFGWYPGKFGVDFNINYFQYTESDELNYDEPDALEFESVVHYAVTDKFRIGVNAAYWIGVDEAEIDGVTLPDTEPMSFKLGLNLTYALSENFIAGIRWMHDVDAENAPMGEWAYIKLAYVF